jgi:hypothetical protein
LGINGSLVVIAQPQAECNQPGAKLRGGQAVKRWKGREPSASHAVKRWQGDSGKEDKVLVAVLELVVCEGSVRAVFSV